MRNFIQSGCMPSATAQQYERRRAIKLKNGYSLPERSEDGNGETLRLVAELVRDIRSAGPNLLVVSTAVGAAQRVAVTLDRIDWPEVIGTLSGDDTIFVATANSSQQRRLRARLRQNLTKAATYD
jgi:transcriptional regulator of arginine metabolism